MLTKYAKLNQVKSTLHKRKNAKTVVMHGFGRIDKFKRRHENVVLVEWGSSPSTQTIMKMKTLYKKETFKFKLKSLFFIYKTPP